MLAALVEIFKSIRIQLGFEQVVHNPHAKRVRFALNSTVPRPPASARNQLVQPILKHTVVTPVSYKIKLLEEMCVRFSDIIVQLNEFEMPNWQAVCFTEKDLLQYIKIATVAQGLENLQAFIERVELKTRGDNALQQAILAGLQQFTQVSTSTDDSDITAAQINLLYDQFISEFLELGKIINGAEGDLSTIQAKDFTKCFSEWVKAFVAFKQPFDAKWKAERVAQAKARLQGRRRPRTLAEHAAFVAEQAERALQSSVQSGSHQEPANTGSPVSPS